MNKLLLSLLLVFICIIQNIKSNDTTIIVQPTSTPMTNCIFSKSYNTVECPDIYSSIYYYSNNIINGTTTNSNTLTLLLLDGIYSSTYVNGGVSLPLNTNSFTMKPYITTSSNVIFSGNSIGNIFLQQNITNNTMASINISNIQFQNISGDSSKFSLFNFNTLQGGVIIPNITIDSCQFNNISTGGNTLMALMNTIPADVLDTQFGIVNLINSSFTHLRNTAIINSQNYQINIDQILVQRVSSSSSPIISSRNSLATIINSKFNTTASSGRTISLVGTTTNIENCLFLNNLVGGAIDLLPSTLFQSPHLNISNCEFNGNQASDGGAILAVGSKTAYLPYPFIQIESSTFTENTANNSLETNGAGGSLYLVNIDIVIQNTTFLQNIATNDGAAIYMSQTTLSLHNSTILDGHVISNTFGNGGGISSSDSTLTITYSSFINNTALSGNNIYCDGSSISIDESTLETNYLNSDPNDKGLNCDNTQCTFLGDVVNVCHKRHHSYWKYSIVVIVAVFAIGIFLYILYQKSKKDTISSSIEPDLTVESPLIA